jgi:hypothetical protein
VPAVTAVSVLLIAVIAAAVTVAAPLELFRRDHPKLEAVDTVVGCPGPG